MKQVFCEICRCYIPSAALVPSHEKGRKHQLLLEKSKEKKRSLNCGVYIRGFKKNSDIEGDLKSLLGRYGAIKDIYVDKEKGRYAIVEFETENAVHSLLNDNFDHIINDQKLIIKPRKERNNGKEGTREKISKKQRKDEDKFSFLLNIKHCKTVTEQMLKLVESQQLPEIDLQLRHKLCELLHEVFKEAYPDCIILPFGSTTSKLGCRGCDLDISLITADLGDYPHKKSKVNSITETDEMAESDSSSLSSRYSKDINDVCEILRKFVPGCKNVFPLRTARCPVIKFLHTDSSLHCDLSINNRLAVRNSDLLRTYCDTDERFRYLSFTIRFWAVSKKLAGKGTLQLNKYALALMVIHYLQQCHPAVLPCLQENTEHARDECLIDGWSCYFNSRYTPEIVNRNSASMGELLFGFFKYFAEFNWGENILSIVAKELQTRSSFLASLEENGLKDLFKTGPVFMPDPFELSHNVAQNLTTDGLEKLKLEINSALSLIDLDMDKSGGIKENISVNNYDNINLVNLLSYEVSKDAMKMEKRKRQKVKCIFDVYGPEFKTSEDVCRRCVDVVSKILIFDLKMQCNIDYQHKKELKPDPSYSMGLGFEISDANKLKVSSNVETQRAETKLESPSSKSNTYLMLCESSLLETERAEPLQDDNHDSTGQEGFPVSKEHDKLTFQANETLGLEDKELSSSSIGKKRSLITTKVSQLPGKIAREDKVELLHAITNVVDCLDNIEILATAWANTWTKRRKQKRILKCLKEVEMKEPNCGDVAPSQVELSAEAKQSYFVDAISKPGTSHIVAHSSHLLSYEDSILVEETALKSQEVLPMESKEIVAVANANTNGPVIVADIKIAVSEQSAIEPRCRIIVKLREADKLNDFHSFFAFFKKNVLDEMKR